MKKSEKINLGQILRARRTELGYTQYELSELIEIKSNLYQKYEYNICRPNFENLLKIFYYLQISLDKISDVFMQTNTIKVFEIEQIKRDIKYSSFVKNNFQYVKKSKK